MLFWKEVEMKHRFAFTGAIAGVISLIALPVQAQNVCGYRSDIVGKLNTQYEEHQAALGLASNGTLLEVFSSKTGSWTILFTQPGGKTCLVATGEKWQEAREPAEVVREEL